MIQGCVKSLLELLGSREIDGRLGASESFLRHDDTSSQSPDFIVTWHASVSALYGTTALYAARKLTC